MEKKQIPNGYTQNDVNKLKGAEKVIHKGAKVVPALIGTTVVSWVGFFLANAAKWDGAAQMALGLGTLIPAGVIVGGLVIANDWRKKDLFSLFENEDLVNYSMAEYASGEKKAKEKKMLRQINRR